MVHAAEGPDCVKRDVVTCHIRVLCLFRVSV